MEPEKPYPRNLHHIFQDVSEVAYFEANTNYTFIHLKNGEKHLLSYTLKRFEEMLGDDLNFSRIHRSYLVNTRHIRHRSTCEVMLKDGLVLPVARRRRG